MLHVGDGIIHDDANFLSLQKDRKDKWMYSAPVGSFDPNGYGLYDMVGNVAEWCSDLYDAEYYSASPVKNPLGPNQDTRYRVLRGAAWKTMISLPGKGWSSLSVSSRDPTPKHEKYDICGFRCVIDVDGNGPPKLNPEGKIWKGN